MTQPVRQPRPLSGVVPPLVTPLLPGGEVDTVSLRRLVRYVVDAGVHGVFVLGSSGEGAFLTDRQREQVTAETIDEVAGAVPVAVGVMDTGTARVTDQLRRLLPYGIDAAVATAPFYGSTHPIEITRHFEQLADVAGDVGVYAYDIPSRVGGTKLAPGTVLGLAESGAIAGVKDSSGQEVSLRRLLLGRRARGLDDFMIFTGSETCTDAAMFNGVDGIVPGLGNVDPAGYVRIFDLMREGRHDDARLEQDRLLTMFDLIDVPDQQRMSHGSAALGAFKLALHLLGVLDHVVVTARGVEFIPDEVAAVRRLLTDAGLMGPQGPGGSQRDESGAASNGQRDQAVHPGADQGLHSARASQAG
ncbi:dihydrodipicolinate synthase family protein [Propionibacteriaceae bacterium Y2011]